MRLSPLTRIGQPMLQTATAQSFTVVARSTGECLLGRFAATKEAPDPAAAARSVGPRGMVDLRVPLDPPRTTPNTLWSKEDR